MFTYAAPGPLTSGFAVVTDRFLGLVSADASAETVAALHRALNSETASIDDGLAVVSGAHTVERFAIAELISGPERIALVAVHGDIVVDLDGAASSRFTWPDGAAWITGEARGVTALRLSLAAALPGAVYLPLRNGAVGASAVAMEASLDPAEAATAPEPSPTGAPARAVAAAGVPEDVPSRSLERQPRRVDLADLMSSKTWTLTLPDGNELVAAPQIVVGRRPWRSSPDETSTYYILVPSPHRQVSGKHVEFAVVGGELHARDLDSTNGTLVLTPDKPPRLLHSGHAVNLGAGDTLDLGEGFRIVVGTRT